MSSPVLAEAPIVDFYDDQSIEGGCGLARDQFIWPPHAVADIEDAWTAARYCVDLLRGSPDLRRRFPRALSEGPDGAFARWLAAAPDQPKWRPWRVGFDRTTNRGAGPRVETIRHIEAAFALLGAGRVEEAVLSRPDVRRTFPLGFTPVGLAALFSWLVNHGLREEGLRLEEAWWFILRSLEDPDAGIRQTYLFTPEWQQLFPDGLTAFGGPAFGAWLVARHGFPDSLVTPSLWTDCWSPARQIRLAYRHRDDWRQFADENAVARELARPGVNVLGHFCYPSGLRTSAEAIVNALRRCDVEVSLRDVRTGDVDEPRHREYCGMEFYDATIIHVQPEPLFETAYQRADLEPADPRTHRIGYWYWELDDVPPEWAAQAAMVDEIWVASGFVASAMTRRLRPPVLTMFPGLELPDVKLRPRAHFGLPDDGEFAFAFVFSMASSMERKNPLGLIAAFRAAFRPEEKVRLVIKTAFGDLYPDLMRTLHEAASYGRITLIDAVFDGDEVLSLVRACDAYVSLHRSEGLGLTMAEAMLLGKPVIATGYSGNLEFMDHRNSLLVDHRLVALDRTVSAYEAGSRWAEPSVEHAAALMRQVYENQPWAAQLGAAARLDAGARMSPQAAGQRMRQRLLQLASRREGSALIQNFI